jgi:hypothetical protein
MSLQWLAQEKGVEGNVIFYNRFVSLEELVEFIGAADVYITPYLNAAQIVSGTLAYTLGAGKAIISTPYWYAEEMLADGRGALVPFRDPAALAAQVIDLLDNEAKRHAMRKRAYLFGRAMIWPQVARRYMESFSRARAERRHFIPPGLAARALDKNPGELPPLKLDHLRHMTDETGMLQHAIFAVPNYREGYTTDDNARALMVSALLEALGHSDAPELASRYLAFIWYAFNPETGRFRNFMDYQRRWLEEGGSDDSHGRALWALGTVLGRSNTPSLQSMAGRVFEQALPAILGTTSPRAWAFALMGIHEYLQRFAGDRRAGQVREELAGRVLSLYQDHRHEEWRWFEPGMTYCNAALPHALLMCGPSIGNASMTEAGLESLTWLASIQRGAAGHFRAIGCNGFLNGRGGPDSTNSRWKRRRWSRLPRNLPAHQRRVAPGSARPSGFLGHNDITCPSMIGRRAAAAMDCASRQRNQARNRPWPFFNLRTAPGGEFLPAGDANDEPSTARTLHRHSSIVLTAADGLSVNSVFSIDNAAGWHDPALMPRRG